MKVLILGGTGTISSAVARECLSAGYSVTLVNRGQSRVHSVPPGARVVQGDVREGEAVRQLVSQEHFDVAIDFLAFTRDHVMQDIEVFTGKVDQFVFISSASAYQTPPSRLPITESTPLRNPYWLYSRDKIDCELVLQKEYRETGFPVTIVRPSHTYDETTVPFDGGWTIVDRMRRGLPVIVPGDGTSLWTLTHSKDFSKAFVPLLGRRDVFGAAFHITSDEALTWNEIMSTLGSAAGVVPKLVAVPSQVIARHDAELGAALLGDKSNSMVFDNSAIKRIALGWNATIPFAIGARQIIEWHDADPTRRAVDPHYEDLFEKLSILGTSTTDEEMVGI